MLYHIAETGLIATIWGKKSLPGKTVALLADMNALPVFEDERCPFHSRNPGVMHACGHDAHMTIALGVARYFRENKAVFSGCVRIFFQPAEEIKKRAKLLLFTAEKSPWMSTVLPLVFVYRLHSLQNSYNHKHLLVITDTEETAVPDLKK